MSLTPPDNTWHMDIGALSHTEVSQCNLTSYSSLNHLNQKLIVVRQLTIDNNVSVSFDPFGFSIFDFHTRISLMRCNSFGPVTLISKCM